MKTSHAKRFVTPHSAMSTETSCKAVLERERERDRACVHPGLKDLRPGSTWRAVNVERKRVAIAAQWGAHEVDDSR